MKTVITVVMVLILIFAVFVTVILSDGGRVTPQGEGTVQLDVGEFEAFVLPDYAAAVIDDAYKSYFSMFWRSAKVTRFTCNTGIPRPVCYIER